MYQTLGCIAQQHNWRLLVLAGLVCCLSGIAAVHLFRRARSTSGVQNLWLAAAGLVTGSGIWATHFIAILAYQPGVEMAYDVLLTVYSLLASISITTFGLWITLAARSRMAAPIGGGVVGLAIATMHYLGMSALQMPAAISWSLPIVAASIIFAVALGAAAISVACLEGKFVGWTASATMSLAVLAHHFIAMEAVSLIADPARPIKSFDINSASLAFAIAGAAIAVLGMGLIAALYDRRLAAHAADYARSQSELVQKSEEQSRARNIQLDAALNNMSQALCMFDGHRRLIVCNNKYASFFKLPLELTTPGTHLEAILDYRIAHGMFQGADPKAYRQERLNTVLGRVPKNSMLEFPDGRVFSVWYQPMTEGGWVATMEDITETTRARRELQHLHETLEVAKAEAERAAAEARAAHQQLIDASNVMAEGLVLLDADDRHVLWNQRYAEMLGDARDALFVGARFEDTVRASIKKGRYVDMVGQDENWVACRMAGLRQPENSFELHLPGDRWFRVDERRTANGGSIGVRVDITELKRREASLRLLFAGNPLPMLVFDKETFQFLDVNDAAVAHYGWSREEFLAMTLFDIRPAKDAGNLRHVAGSRDGSYLEGAVWRHNKANGDEIQVAIYSRPLEHEGRSAALVAVVDVTQARDAAAQVAATRQFLDSVIENAPAPIIVKDARSLQHVLINRSAEAFLGVARSSVIGKTVEQIYSPQSAAYISGQNQFVLETLKEVSHGEHLFETPGNGNRYATSKRIPIFDEKGDPRYILTMFNDTTQRRLADERIAHLKSHDILTGLPNRAIFGERLADTLDDAASYGVAAICIDFDRFKEINDAYGYIIGDRILAMAARRLLEAAGYNFLARVGGDEFNLIVTSVEQPAELATLAESLLNALAAEIEIEGIHVKVGLSIGVALAPSDGRDAATLVANAEAALYRAKSEGRGIVRFFEAEMEKALRERRALEHELKVAVAHGQLRLYYQPQTDVAGVLLGFEALLRWFHPLRGLVPPDVFIPIAEESGLIGEIGAWTMREACREAASWPGALSVAVNISPIQFRDRDFFTLIHTVLVETGLPGHRLELEITEGALIADSARALSVLRRAKALGVRIAMDDFGTGYSSLSYLQSFPFDKIKIDRSFIIDLERNPQSVAIVRGVLGLSHGLNLPVIAEGVETDEQLKFLEREGCDEIQGYLVGRPQPIEEYISWIYGITPKRAAVN